MTQSELKPGQVVDIFDGRFKKWAVVTPPNSRGNLMVVCTLGGWLCSIKQDEVQKIHVGETHVIRPDLLEYYRDWDDTNPQQKVAKP